MQFGVSMFSADFAISVVELARVVEEHGFESLFFPLPAAGADEVLPILDQYATVMRSIG